jgi:hypothetical protein
VSGRLADYLEHEPLDYKDRRLVHLQKLFVELSRQQLEIPSSEID